jgi:hypothetical protein
MMGEQVFVMNRYGVGRAVDAAVVRTEAWRIAEVRSAGVVPEGVSSKICEAPARGPVRVVGVAGSAAKALMRADVFDVMAAKAARHKKSAPFSPGQVAMARHYRDLVERHACAGMQCTSLETMSGGGSGGGCFMDAVLRDRDEIKRLHRRIGDGAALVVRRHRPSKRGSRASIPDRRLVDMVCLEDRSLSEVLEAHGWSVKSDYRVSLRKALSGALDRMAGPVFSGRVGVVTYGEGCVSLWD